MLTQNIMLELFKKGIDTEITFVDKDGLVKTTLEMSDIETGSVVAVFTGMDFDEAFTNMVVGTVEKIRDLKVR